jgi:hypothetical protein
MISCTCCGREHDGQSLAYAHARTRKRQGERRRDRAPARNCDACGREFDPESLAYAEARAGHQRQERAEHRRRQRRYWIANALVLLLAVASLAIALWRHR